MVREDILGGLELAMSRGETLEQAMYSFYNAGYKKQDIEEAAMALSNPQAAQNQQNQTQQNQVQQQQASVSQQQPMQQSQPSQQQPQQPMQQPQPPQMLQTQPLPTTQAVKPAQNVSDYSGSQGINVKRVIILSVLVFLLLMLLSSLIGIFVFRETIIDFLNSVLS